MKNYLSVLAILFYLITTQNTNSQILDSLISPTKEYEKDLFFKKDLFKTNKGDTTKRKFNNKMLHLMFANKIGTSFGGSNDLSLQKYYFGLDNEDKSISIGFNIDSRGGKKLKKLNWVFSGALKLTSANNFATIIDGDGKFLNDNIGASYKISWIKNGTINYKESYTKRRAEAVIFHRDTILYKKYDKKVDKFNKDELKEFTENHEYSIRYDDDLKDIKSVLKEKHNTLYEEMAQEEIDFIEKNKMYNFVSTQWLSLELFTPFGGITYEVTPDENSPYVEDRFYNISATLSGTYMRAYSNGESVFLKASFNIKNNNTIIVDNVTIKSFQTSTTGANNNLILTNTDVYITPYKEFYTPSLTIEPTYFFISNSLGDFGISPSIEFNFGTYNKTNWKLGLPISLKDKEGKPSINFEFQYKSIKTFDKSVDVFGISTNFLFGDLIN